MKSLTYCVLIITSGFSFYQCDHSDDGLEVCALQEYTNTNPQFYKVLFIGNSHTYTYDIPQTIEMMASSVGDSIYTNQETPGGYTFRQHSSRIETLMAIQSEKWDYVVLQGGGWMQAFPDFMADTAVTPYAQTLAKAIRKNSTQTKIILYMTHGYRDGVLTFNATDWCDQDPLVCNYDGMQKRIRENYLNLATLLDAEIAPSGMMWKAIMDENPDMNLYQGDGVHASQNGSYIAACTIYSVISKKRPANIFWPPNINEENALAIQQTVSEALFDCQPNWRKYPIE